jgi:hypothetical protein
MGMTVISGTTVSSGCWCTKRTAFETLFGSQRVFTSMSGKRLSKLAVRIPSAITAVTSMLLGRTQHGVRVLVRVPICWHGSRRPSVVPAMC